MKFAMDTDLLAETITAAISSLPARPTSPVLGGVLVEVGIGSVTMSSFNYERATKRTAAAMDVTEPDTAVVSGKLLAAIGGNLPRNKDATVDVSGQEMVITAGRTAFRLPLLHGEDFPELPIMKPREDAIGTVDGDTFAEAVQPRRDRGRGLRPRVQAGRSAATLPSEFPVRCHVRQPGTRPWPHVLHG
ncbi:hypothetical protein [Mycobacteroides abscessus]|uniref:hypothetical protein n=1 Tax=Mycobacteroides abscessus TaxID=36809 RepID=UPI00266C3610|nr:hypothetical protein [Mycobacteroides abscessus]MDO2982003.1 hypothetical protein [Mycobacteroides abscessus subsp. abscessus]